MKEGGETMNLEVTQGNLYLFLPSKVSRMAEIISEDENIGIVEAIKRIYSSRTYHNLEKESSKLWHLGPVDLYREFETEK